MHVVVWHRQRRTAQASTSCSRTACKITTLTFRVGTVRSGLCKAADCPLQSCCHSPYAQQLTTVRLRNAARDRSEYKRGRMTEQ